MQSATVALFLLLTSSTALAQTNTDCGIERWNVKTLTDADTTAINWQPVTSSVHALNEDSTVSPGMHDARRADERQVYRLEGQILQYKLESDGDIHIVLRDPDSSTSIVCEIPNPDCPSLQGTSHVAQYRTARDWFIQNVGNPLQTFTYMNPPKTVNLIGVGYYDPYHGQTGVSRGNREIHPVLAIGEAQDAVENRAAMLSGQISVSPNPAQTKIDVTISIQQPEHIMRYGIVDDSGRAIRLYAGDKTLNYLQTQLPISNLPNGTYLFEVITTSGMIARKFVVMR